MTEIDSRHHKSTPELERLLEKRSQLNGRFYMMMFENLGIFGVPAGLALFWGLQLRAEWGNMALFILLGLALAISWLVFFRRYRFFTEKLGEVERLIKEERKRAGIPEPESPGYPDEEDDEKGADDEW